MEYKKQIDIPSLQLLFPKGIPGGVLIEIFGPPSSGKTCLSLELSKNYTTLLINAEFSFFKELALYVRKDLDNISISNTNDINEIFNLISNSLGIFDYIILDSLAGVYSNQTDINKFFNKLSSSISKSTTSLIVTNQLRNKKYSYKKRNLGGKEVNQYFDLIFKINEKKIDRKRNFYTTIDIIKNKLSVPTLTQFNKEWENK